MKATLSVCFVVILFCFRNATAQDYLLVTRERIVEHFKDLKDSDYRMTVYDTLGTVNVEIEGYEKIQTKYFFNSEDRCDSVILNFFCSDCVDHHRDEILADKKRKWKQVSAESYVATRPIKIPGKSSDAVYDYPWLTIERTKGQLICNTIVISIVKMQKSELKKLIEYKPS